eukprot:gene3342-2324_t
MFTVLNRKQTTDIINNNPLNQNFQSHPHVKLLHNHHSLQYLSLIPTINGILNPKTAKSTNTKSQNHIKAYAAKRNARITNTAHDNNVTTPATCNHSNKSG